MTLWSVVAKSAFRNRGRAALTILGAVIALLAFIALRTVLDAWAAGAEHAAMDRLTTRNSVSFGMTLPKRYIDDIRAHIPNVKSVTYCDWFGARWAKMPNEFFANLACADNAFEVYPEVVIDPAALTRWKADKQGAIVGEMLAKKHNWQVGDKVALVGTFYPGDWELTVDGIYSAPPKSGVDRSSFFFHWEYKNAGVRDALKDQIGWVFTRIDDPTKAAQVSRSIDALFEDRDIGTLTMSERAANNSMLGAVSALLAALDIVSMIILGIMTLILGNTVAMSVRERSAEFGMLRAIGFEPKHIRRLVIAEILLLSTVAAAFALVLAFPLIEGAFGGWLEENAGKFFPTFRITLTTVMLTVVSSLLLGATAALLPALRAGRLSVCDALRTLD